MQAAEENKNSLSLVPEWLFVLLMLSFLGFLAFTCLYTRTSFQTVVPLPLHIRVVGEVEEEKELTLAFGATILDALSLVRPKSTASLENLALDGGLSNGQIL